MTGLAACRVNRVRIIIEIELERLCFKCRILFRPRAARYFRGVSRFCVNRVSHVQFSVLASVPCQPCLCHQRNSLQGGRV